MARVKVVVFGREYIYIFSPFHFLIMALEGSWLCCSLSGPKSKFVSPER